MSETTIIYLLTGTLIGTIIGFVLRIRKIQYELDFTRGQAHALQNIIDEKDKLIDKYSELVQELTQKFEELYKSYEDFLKEQGIEV